MKPLSTMLTGSWPRVNPSVSTSGCCNTNFAQRVVGRRQFARHYTPLRPARAATLCTLQSPKQKNKNAMAGLHKPLGLILGSSFITYTAVELSNLDVGGHPMWMPALLGASVGATFAILLRFCQARVWLQPRQPLNVVITGSSRGIGKSLAREFLRCGDNVLVTGRNSETVETAVAELTSCACSGNTVHGISGIDVSNPDDVDSLVESSKAKLGGHIDVWINNAGVSGSFKSFIEHTPQQMEAVVKTNLLGSILCTRAVMLTMKDQHGGGHIFNMDGAGADGSATPSYAAYGSTKAAIAQLHKSLQNEAAQLPEGSYPVCIHTLSPGMVLTDLLLDGSTLENLKVFNILCEQPETVAAYLVPRARSAVAHGRSGLYIKYLTPVRAAMKFLAAGFTMNKYFDKNGNPVYPSECERLLAKKTARVTARAAQRGSGVAVAYSLSIVLGYLFFVADAIASGHNVL